MLLESIHSPADVRALPAGQLPQLCQELREFLVRSVSETGGHLASNLGIGFLTLNGTGWCSMWDISATSIRF